MQKKKKQFIINQFKTIIIYNAQRFMKIHSSKIKLQHRRFSFFNIDNF